MCYNIKRKYSAQTYYDYVPKQVAFWVKKHVVAVFYGPYTDVIMNI